MIIMKMFKCFCPSSVTNCGCNKLRCRNYKNLSCCVANGLALAIAMSPPTPSYSTRSHKPHFDRCVTISPNDCRFLVPLSLSILFSEITRTIGNENTENPLKTLSVFFDTVANCGNGISILICMCTHRTIYVPWRRSVECEFKFSLLLRTTGC